MPGSWRPVDHMAQAHLEKRSDLDYVRAHPMATKLPTPPRVGMVSLGCPKNLVDSERILTQLRADGYQMSPDYAGADVVLVNTCGFLDSAKEESLEAIGELWVGESAISCDLPTHLWRGVPASSKRLSEPSSNRLLKGLLHISTPGKRSPIALSS